MTRPLLRHALPLFVSVAVPALALAAPNPYGLNLTWDQCFGDGGTANRHFACDTNTGSERLVTSFVVDQPIPNVNGMEIHINIASDSPVLPQWWSMKNTGTCRATSLAFTVSPPNPTSTICSDWSTGQASAGIATYNIGVAGTNTVKMVAVEAVPPGLGLVMHPGVQYFTGSFLVNHAKTVGLGACSGCQVPVCLVYSYMRVFVDDQQTPWRVLNTPANTPNSNVATWQGGQVVGLQPNCDPVTGVCSPSFICATQPVNSRPSTWGAVKSLYR
jgi:hypothetical protein